MFLSLMKILIVGNGYLGKRCLASWPDAVTADGKINAVDDVLKILEQYQPEAVLNAAGVVGRPNVDWCEDHQMETVRGNTILPLLIADACQQKNVYLLHVGSGCIFYGQSPRKEGWREDDFANPSAMYTCSKYAADLVLAKLSNVGIARIRMPLDYIPATGNLIDKLVSFKKVADVVNSITVVEDMIKVFRQLLEIKATGIFHVVNPGAISHKEIIAMYEEIIDLGHKCEWVSESELVESGLAKKKRSNNIMQSENLAKLEIKMRPVKESVREAMIKYSKIINSKS